MTTTPTGGTDPGADPGAGGARPTATGPGAMPPTSATVLGSAAESPPRFDPAGPVTAPIGRDSDGLAEPVAAAVLACPAVSRLSAGPFGTYLPGRRVTGVQITAAEVTVWLVARPVAPRTMESQIRAAVATIVPGLPVHIAVDDLDTDQD